MLHLYRYNGESVRTVEGAVTIESSKALVWQYLGDLNHRTPLTVEPSPAGPMTVRTPCSFFTVASH